MKNIILIGFMGSGKTSTGKYVAQKLNRPILSSDEMIVQKEGQPIAQVFEKSGETYFRQIEKNVVKELATKSNVVIDCGGGVILDPENIVTLKKNGIIIYLITSPEFIYQRVKNRRHRPLLNVPDPQSKIRELLEQRQSLYESSADLTINTDGKTPQQVGEELLKIFHD
ncbi:MAG: shikimate kinase [Candidatus Omnitrophica bacterium]|nr:shikimate kinase [Candidatus Omnitrophota bacterium]